MIKRFWHYLFWKYVYVNVRRLSHRDADRLIRESQTGPESERWHLLTHMDKWDINAPYLVGQRKRIPKWLTK
jgi:hypothetical protein